VVDVCTRMDAFENTISLLSIRAGLKGREKTPS
jgi:hypothetical protein